MVERKAGADAKPEVDDPQQPIRAFAVSSTLQPRVVERLFAAGAERVKVTKTMAVARYGEKRR